MDAQFRDTDNTMAFALKRTAASIQGETVTLKELLEVVGEQGLLLFCALLTVPFLLPVSIPGVSTVFGIVIILIGVGVTLNRVPWLPRRLMSRRLLRAQIVPMLDQGARIFERIERWVQPRLLFMTGGAGINRINGLALTASGVLLLFPLSLIPFSNTLPAITILLFIFGLLQRDGYFIVTGYAALVATLLYFGGLALMMIAGGQALLG
ncbi:MAG: exopolysaccharide biosynthesis protein [Anaerolineae bacterium]|nr:exopolysaccharide biosynthesis protein [Anaerolineae bacterium]